MPERQPTKSQPHRFVVEGTSDGRTRRRLILVTPTILIACILTGLLIWAFRGSSKPDALTIESDTAATATCALDEEAFNTYVSSFASPSVEKKEALDKLRADGRLKEITNGTAAVPIGEQNSTSEVAYRKVRPSSGDSIGITLICPAGFIK